MNKTVIAVALAMAMGSAFAGDNNGPRFGGGDNSNRNTNLNSAGASARSNAIGVGMASNKTVVGVGVNSSNRNTNKAYGGNAHQGQLQGQLQGQVQGQDNDQDMTYNESNAMHYSGSYDVKTNPSMGLGGISPTVPCAIPVEGTYSGVGIGIGLGTAYVEDGCVRDRLIKSGLTSGNPEAVAKAAQLLNHDLDAELAKIAPRKSEQPVASGADSSERDVWAFQNL